VERSAARRRALFDRDRHHVVRIAGAALIAGYHQARRVERHESPRRASRRATEALNHFVEAVALLN
jgi:hypothetical protein